MSLLRLQVRPACGILRCHLGTSSTARVPAYKTQNFPRFQRPSRQMASVAKATPLTIPHLTAPSFEHARQRYHVDSVNEHLQQKGILKISLGFPDPDSQYLKELVISLHEHHGHQLPISHSASQGWFWDVRPSSTSFQTANHQARSETMENFPWHTDCSYEELPPRFFALHVLQHDRFGGGALSIMNIQQLSESLSASTRTSLMRQEYNITIPLEFIKEPTKQNIVGSILAADQEGQPGIMRYRRDILTPLTERASKALQELDMSLERTEAQSRSRVDLAAEDIPAGSIILMNNHRWLHARNNINDPKRHLRRVRWDAVPFPGAA
ncbi:hypothetical protein NUW58_g2089 [Xylaria curta]|uniref:Uncharacterized protein n=1 Tax=Xylaria curta TaxID=42375 RepID=A0ACC1PIG1_9PEZI|nr:hypothetical protein NUW58_g2089 [Xylaria curta]